MDGRSGLVRFVPYLCLIDRQRPAGPAIARAFDAAIQSGGGEPAIGPGDETFDIYPEHSIEQWHRDKGLWLD